MEVGWFKEETALGLVRSAKPCYRKRLVLTSAKTKDR